MKGCTRRGSYSAKGEKGFSEGGVQKGPRTPPRRVREHSQQLRSCGAATQWKTQKWGKKWEKRGKFAIENGEKMAEKYSIFSVFFGHFFPIFDRGEFSTLLCSCPARLQPNKPHLKPHHFVSAFIPDNECAASALGVGQCVFAGTAVSRPFAMKVFAGVLLSNFWFGRLGGLRSTLSTLFINFTHKPNALLWELALTVFDSIANWS